MNDAVEPPPAIHASYGSWPSPISAELVAYGANATVNIVVEGDVTYLCEMRPANKGRNTIIRRDFSGQLLDVTPPDFNVRTFVHEYGGGAFAVSNGTVYASSASDHKIYVFTPGSPPTPLTQGQIAVEHEGSRKWKGVRFADMHVTGKGIVAIGELHEPGSPVENFLALIDTTTGEYRKIASGCDFYSCPVISPDETHIAWISWDHPEMPWTNTKLWIAKFKADGQLDNPHCIAGEHPESIVQPQWSSTGKLYFITDREKGWWNLHCYYDGHIENVCPMEAEAAEPLWLFQRSSYAFLGDKIVLAYNSLGKWNLGILDPVTRKFDKLKRDSTAIHQLRSGNNFVQFLEGYASNEEALVQLDNSSSYPTKVLRQNKTPLNEGYISTPLHVEFPSGSKTAFGFYYPPHNQDISPPSNEKPPLVVMIHGGPTAQCKASFALSRQYWTSRGFAILDVNYRGSTGYGREYRNLLRHNWGIVDVEDCINGALFLVNQGLADENKLVIRGGSAGGYTTLATLTSSNAFKAGASYYGVADITALAHDTHKFEQWYMEWLIGKYPEEKELWEKRSPINSVDKIRNPLIIFQGENDPIVPKNQSIMIYEGLKKGNIPVEIHIYPGEEHGFKQPVHIIHSLESEANFYRKHLCKSKSGGSDA